VASGVSNERASGFQGTVTAFVIEGGKLNMSRFGARKPDKSFWHRITWEFVGLMFGVLPGASFSQVESGE